MGDSTTRNRSINVLKGISCFSVILLHASFPGILGKILYGFARFAVPFFFMVSGYFSYNSNYEDLKNKLPNKIKHIFAYFVFAEIIYLIWHVFDNYFLGGKEAVLQWVNEVFTLTNFVKLLIFQTAVIGDVSWFMIALILCYVSVFFIGKHDKWDIMFIISLILLVINVIVGEALPFLGCKIQWYFNSNFLLLGCPFFYIGASVKRRMPKFDDKNLITMLLFGMGLVLVERVFTSASQFFAGTFFMTYSIFIYAVHYPNGLKCGWVEKVGENYTFGIYILHPIVRDICDYFLKQNVIYYWARPILIFLISLLIFDLFTKSKSTLYKLKKCVIR